VCHQHDRQAHQSFGHSPSPKIREKLTLGTEVTVNSQGRQQEDAAWMHIALKHAREAALRGEVPVGAVMVLQRTVIAAAANATVATGDPSAHAEMVVIRAAADSIGAARFPECTLYVTMEPCAMCAGAIVLARLCRVVFGCWDDKAGMVGSVGDILRHRSLNHSPEVAAGVLADECSSLLREFFRSRR
jgi:tRNA(adenine34) deaminase